MSNQMFFNQDPGQWLFKLITSMVIISLILFIVSDVRDIVCFFSNANLAKTLFGIVLFVPANFILLAALLLRIWGGFRYICIEGYNDCEKAKQLLKNRQFTTFIAGILILLSDFTFLKNPLGSNLSYDYSSLLVGIFVSEIYTEWSAIPEEDRYARFIALLKEILPIQFQEECLGDVREQHHQLIEEGIPRCELSWITLLTGLGVIRYYLWLKFHKLVSRWITRA